MKNHAALTQPRKWLLLALAYNLLCAVVALAIALQQPWLGLTLEVQEQQVLVRKTQGPSIAIPVDAQLLAISQSARETAMDIQALDLLEEPDVLAQYAELETFFARQKALAQLLSQSPVTLHWRSSGSGQVQQTTVEPTSRPLFALPLIFWFQIIISVAGSLIAAWVWVLRPQVWGVRMFALTGLLFPLFVMPAAVYGSRELALPGNWFPTLSAMNHGAAYLFGAATACIFACHPMQLIRPRKLLWIFGFFSLWGLTDLLRIAPNIDWGNRFLVTAELLLCVVLATIQWNKSRGEPAERAALRWLFLSLLLGSGLFIISSIITVVLGWSPPLPQGYAFGFFLLIYIGIALGLRRYRLFEIQEWAFHLFVWLGGALAVLALDAALIVLLDWSAGPALGVSLWVCGVLYFPLRQWLWQKWVERPSMQWQELMPDVVALAFQPSAVEREKIWNDLLQRLFQPLELQSSVSSLVVSAQLEEEGLTLVLPACGGVGARIVRYPNQGKRLFSSRDLALIQGVCQLMQKAQASREAHEQGVREERRRVARDMHDDVGARLLMLMHRAHQPELAELARAAMNDLRTALAALDAQPVPVAEALADWRAEASSRCDAAGRALEWSSSIIHSGYLLTARQKSVLERFLREGLTNALKHANSTLIQIQCKDDEKSFHLTMQNDGVFVDPDQWQEGRGMTGMRQRLVEVGANLQIVRLHSGAVALRIDLPKRGA